MATHILGIRHHGPGSARHLLEAIQEIKPEIILIEGPPEGEALLSWVNHPEMRTPVAMLLYVPEQTQKAVFYPFAEFSPEWQAMKYGTYNNLPVRFIDIPLIHKFGKQLEEEAKRMEAEQKTDGQEEQNSDATQEQEQQQEKKRKIRQHPLDYLASLDGYDDEDEWWEQLVERRHGALEAFEAIGEAMTALREDYEEEDPEDLIREAFMRTHIRKAEKEKYERILVVCGAWHVPALQNMPSQKADDELVKKLPKVKVEATWIPWTNPRLSFESGYGAGIKSPGWYEHIWNTDDPEGITWLVNAARIFRKNRMDVSSAHVIETVRLASSLASMRELSKPGLKEFGEAIQSVMCFGDAMPLLLIDRELFVGNSIGTVPEGAPKAPLQSDLEMLQKRLRLKPEANAKQIVLDLRESNDLQKSVLLHRLRLLGVNWGAKTEIGGKGTFKEAWTLEWEPELMINLVEKAIWGNTIELAASAYLSDQALSTKQLSGLTSLLELAIPSELPQGVQIISREIENAAAGSGDVIELMKAFLPLVQIRRYGNVRNTDVSLVSHVMDGLMARISVGLPSACGAVDEDSASSIAETMRSVEQGISVLEIQEYKEEWYSSLRKMADDAHIQPMIAGCASKILFDARWIEMNDTENYFLRALSPSAEPMHAAWWLEGFLKGSAATLLFEDKIWDLINSWMSRLEWDHFQTVVPLLRRTFADYSPAEKRKLAEKVRLGDRPSRGGLVATLEVDEIRARKVLPVLRKILLKS